MKEAFLMDLGRMRYREAWEIQKSLHARRARNEIPDTLIFVEHFPVITLGRSARREHLRLPVDALQKQGVEVLEVERGGDVTFHGIGQLVGYPIFRLEELRRVHAFVRNIETALVEALNEFQIPAFTIPGYTGVWVPPPSSLPPLWEKVRERRYKMASIGLAIRQGVSFHGFALNVSTTLSYFDLIVPCGIPDVQMTSMEEWLHQKISMEEVKESVARSFADIFQLTFCVPHSSMTGDRRPKTGNELPSSVPYLPSPVPRPLPRSL